jgi:hypothetical protein
VIIFVSLQGQCRQRSVEFPHKGGSFFPKGLDLLLGPCRQGFNQLGSMGEVLQKVSFLQFSMYQFVLQHFLAQTAQKCKYEVRDVLQLAFG